MQTFLDGALRICSIDDSLGHQLVVCFRSEPAQPHLDERAGRDIDNANEAGVRKLA